MDSRRMDDTQHPANFPPLTIEQICELAAAIRDVFGGNLSRESFALARALPATSLSPFAVLPAVCRTTLAGRDPSMDVHEHPSTRQGCRPPNGPSPIARWLASMDNSMKTLLRNP
jgi:hypothetical protein